MQGSLDSNAPAGVKLVPTGCLMKAIVEQIDAEVAQEALCSGISI